jgi:kynureninase
MERRDAERLDDEDGLREWRDHFGPHPSGIYMDGNSLGRPPRAVAEAAHQALDEWSRHLVGGWDDWLDLPSAVGDRLGRLVGAGPGQVVVCDSTTVNLYKLASAALAASPDRSRVVGLSGDFPTDRYVLQSLCDEHQRELALAAAPDDIEAHIDDRTALVCLSHVHFVTGRRLDAARITAAAHDRGALVLWDLAHSAGAVPVDLDGWGADLAVGCTYKYLNAGPGAPGYLYVNRDRGRKLRQPIWGWFGQAHQFAMGDAYQPAGGVRSYLTGTPGIVALRMVDAALQVIEEAGVERLWAKSVGLTSLLLDRVDVRLGPLGVSSPTPRRPQDRGAHIALSHPLARAWCRYLIDHGMVIGDFRPPDALRIAPAPLYTRYVDCFDAVEAMAEALASGPDGCEPGAPRAT